MEVRWAEKRWFLEGLLREVERKKEGVYLPQWLLQKPTASPATAPPSSAIPRFGVFSPISSPLLIHKRPPPL
ncbi:hypothetical protein QJS10_CPB18g00543 [Acorus calamus]|uniref:Uncharacterized protein n=1 Tax=Acorus calamus TaxID=4465 RepID=A0AAV9CLW2_ACOCL|nr:hypothetical protein QJS10_CPB18g00543 [Acorus calamus]